MRKHYIALLIAVVIGYAYYQVMEKDLPTDTNCSYIASPMTDYLAFVFGCIIINYGIKYDNPILTALGGSIVVEHIFQFKRK